ncbi:hypothetical protein [Phenylobacterium sp.]|uniref:hypothetical protein n=1 Tax=Phenylobacterium sp. TaxID=1871053 RepID=UPI0035AF521E
MNDPGMYDPGRLLVSLHIPKTAGSSLREALAGWFGQDLALHYRGDQGEPPIRHAPRPGLCVHGHFNRLRGIGALDYYPAADQFITFLREPFDRFVSLWRYLHFQKRSGVLVPDLDDDPTFETWLERRREASEAGDDPFSFLAQLPWAIAPGQAADPFGPQFLFVGLVERYDSSLAGLAEALGKSAPPPVHVNRASDAFRKGDPAGDFAAFRARHEAAFPLEHAVYAAAERRAP